MTAAIRKVKAFTLIELLIVVAIIAILAAIAVPNFLEAQVRSKVSRAKADMRSMATAIESYYVDYNAFPMCNNFGIPVNNTTVLPAGTQNWPVLEVLSTPVAYITNSLLKEPFVAQYRTGSVYTGNDPQPGFGGAASYATNDVGQLAYQTYQYHSVNDVTRAFKSQFQTPINSGPGRAWTYMSCGPDRIYLNMGGVLANNSGSVDGRTPDQKKAYCTNLLYDPTNGTISFGELFRVGGNVTGDYAHFLFEQVQKQN